MAKYVENKKSSLLQSVEERASSKKLEKKRKNEEEEAAVVSYCTDLIPHLPKDCISDILVRLPLDALQRSRFVCKLWYNMIHNSSFIDAHLRRSESVLIFLSPIPQENSYLSKPNAFSVEAKLLCPNSFLMFNDPRINRDSKSIHFLEFKDGKGRIGEYKISCLGNIRATCNGLILLDDTTKKGGLVVMNPVTRKLMALPLGTICSKSNESYGFCLSNDAGNYKVVHLFRDSLGFVNCEILSLGSRFWKEVDGPSSALFDWLRCDTVSAIGALHWFPQVKEQRGDSILSMDLEKEKFHQVPLPKASTAYDSIIEFGGFLGFVAHCSKANQIEIWILKDLLGDVWTKQHCITSGCMLFDVVPKLSLGMKGEMVFKSRTNGAFYVYNFQLKQMRKVMFEKGVSVPGSVLPHVNSLVSWSGSLQFK
ncbi:hypothetical protein UlMin_034652 [Ulmus minor]